MTADGGTPADWLAGLNPAQRQAVQHVHGPLLVLAGAGSGKTRVLVTRIAALIEEHGVPPERIFAVTFTNKAAGEMRERIGRLLRRDPAGLWIGTFHSLSARLLRREAELLGFTRQYTIYDEDDKLAVVKAILERKGHPVKLFPPKAVAGLISWAKNRLEGPDALANRGPFDRLGQVAAEVYRVLPEEFRQRNAMDFDDLLLHPLTLFRQHPDRLEAWRGRFSFVLVDEFQDTNKAQYELVRALGAHGNVCAVGDDDQSIYGWRGADVRNMREFQQDFPGTALVRLELNYRSTQVVLDAANAVIAENTGRLGKTLLTRRAGGESITVLAAADDRDEAEWAAGELRRRAGEGTHRFPDMAVLYRTNAQSRAFEEAFRRAGVPYRLVGAVSFYDRREVKDLLAYLRLAVNPADDEAFLRAVQVPKRGLGESSLQLLGDQARAWGKPLLETARIADRVPDLRPQAREAFRVFAGAVDRLAADAATAQPADVLEALIRAIDFEGLLAAEGPEGLDRWENVRELVASAANWSETEGGVDEDGPPVGRFLAQAALVSAVDKEAGREEGVTMMTLHTAKGLEWPVVLLAGLEDGLFPLARATEQPEGVEEERRLCYVGVTRAKDKLYISWARSRRRGGELRPGIPSRFLRALPPGIVEERTTSSVFGGGGGGRSEWRSGGRPSWSGERRPAAGAAPRPPARPAATPPPEEASQDAPRYVKGERVRHRRFGGGTIRGLAGAGRELKVEVQFDDAEVGIKTLLVAYAGLEREWESA
ncbi:MAG: UvrD-helicase domain-containing protein [Gemmatimonadales bacterium]|nr:UvrD-helicase domain-containing protein [Gemmatimonadales bacterium]